MERVKLLDGMRAVLRTRHYSIRTEDAYVQWVKRFILFHRKKHPSEMGSEEINEYLTHLAVKRHGRHPPRARRWRQFSFSIATC